MVKPKDFNIKPEAHRRRTKVLVVSSLFIVAVLAVGVVSWRRFQHTGLPSVSIRYQGGSGEFLVVNTGESPVKVWAPYRVERKQGNVLVERNWMNTELPNHSASVVLPVPNASTGDGPWRVWVKVSDYRICHWLQKRFWNSAVLGRFDVFSAGHGRWIASEWISELPGQSPEPLVITAYNSFKPPPYEQWLALGAGVEPRTRGPSLAEWAALKGEHEPQLLGRTLSAWLLRAAPTPTASDTVQSIAALREDAALAVNETGTNVIPWLLQWAQDSSPQNHLLSRRGFGMLNQRAALVVPALGELACSEMPALRARAYRCFTSIGPDWATIWPALVPALHQQDPATRMQAAEYLCQNYPLECKGIGLDKFIQPYSPLYWYLLHYTNSAGAQELDR